jgi:hypothetical protein
MTTSVGKRRRGSLQRIPMTHTGITASFAAASVPSVWPRSNALANAAWPMRASIESMRRCRFSAFEPSTMSQRK